MKKFALLALTLSAMLAFTACGAEKTPATETPAGTEAPVAEETEAAEETEETEETAEETEELTVEVVSETEKVAKLSDEKGTTVATLTLADGKPVAIAFDYILEDGSSKYEAAKEGTYDMGEGSTPWNEQADAVAAFLAENEFDVTKITLTDDEGHTDAITGVSIKVPAFVKVAEAVLAE